MKFKGVVIDVRAGIDVSTYVETIFVTTNVEVKFNSEQGSVFFSCPVNEAPRVGDTYMVEVTRLDLPPQS